MAGLLLATSCASDAAEQAASPTRPDVHRTCPRLTLPEGGGLLLSDSESNATKEGIITREDRYESTSGGIVTFYSGVSLDELLEDFEPAERTVVLFGEPIPVLALGELLAAEWQHDDGGPGCQDYGVLSSGLTIGELQVALERAQYS